MSSFPLVLQHSIRALALRVLREILRNQPARFKNYAELTIMKTLEAHKDSHKEVSQAWGPGRLNKSSAQLVVWGKQSANHCKSSKKESLPLNWAHAIIQGENPIAAIVAERQCSSKTSVSLGRFLIPFLCVQWAWPVPEGFPMSMVPIS